MGERGPIVARSTERWVRFPHAKTQTGLMIKMLAEDNFEVFDFTTEAKTPAARRKSRPRSSKAAT